MLQICFYYVQAKSQTTNELRFNEAVLKILDEKQVQVDSLAGFVSDDLAAKIKLVPASQRTLVLETPKVHFQRLGQGQFLRVISAVVSFVDSVEVGFPLELADTIAAADLHRVRHSKESALRGVDPRYFPKYVAPFLMIGISIAAIITLFYLRS